MSRPGPDVLAWVVPVALAAALWAVRRPRAAERTGMLLASAWLLATLLPVNALAVAQGWWRFAAAADGWPHLPTAMLLGWVVAWGVLPVLALPRVPTWAAAALALWLDLLLMPRLGPRLVLGDGWLLGEALVITLAFIPARMLAAWTADGRRLHGRAALQAACFAVLLLGALPDAVEAAVRVGWPTGVLRLPPLVSLGVALQVIVPPALLGLAAVHEFAVRGGGTPVPFDPPRRLVRSGPYAFVANPMQLAATVVLVLWGMMVGRPWVAAAGVMAVVYSAGLAAFDEGADLGARFGEPWAEYRRHVRAWLPRWRPWHPSLDGGAEPARLYVAQGCGVCSELGAAVLRMRPLGLVVVAAEEHPARQLVRITYDPRDGGGEEDGIAALARALEHVNFATAMLGMAMRLPIIRPLLQRVVDASGGGSQVVAWRGGGVDRGRCAAGTCEAPRAVFRSRGGRSATHGFIALGS